MKNSLIKNYCLIVEYIGTNYVGFQSQKNGISVQQVLEEAISKAVNEKVKIVASGRTDAGVHALGQVVNFHCQTTIPEDKLKIVINLNLPKDIRVKSSFEVRSDFHSRKSAHKKTYMYRIFVGETLSAFDENRVLFVKNKLDVKKMNEAAKFLVGEHDFSSFVSTGGTTTNKVRTIFSSFFSEKENYITYEICGNGFLYNMVRIIVGTLLDVGMGKTSPEQFGKILNAKDRKEAGKTAPPYALYLKNVEY